MQKLSRIFCLRNRCVVLSEDDRNVKIGLALEKTTDKENGEIEMKSRLERFYMGREVQFVNIEMEQFEVIVRRMGLENKHLGIQNKEEKDSIPDLMEEAQKAPVVSLLSSLIGDGILQDISDIHIETFNERCIVRFRKDGDLFLVMETSGITGQGLVSRIKLLANLNIMEHRKCQDGKFCFPFKETVFDIRVSCIPGNKGESVVLRILGGSRKAGSLEELGFSKMDAAALRNFGKLEKGLVLVTGSTGMGKTTTLASLLSELCKEKKKIITIEDPVEYELEGAVQIQVDEKIGKTFVEILKRVLRHDPDILLVGEIRDKETAELALRLALTGHLVFATLHTGSAEETVTRLLDLGAAPFILCDVLKGVVSQRLVKKEGGGRKLEASINSFTSNDLKNWIKEMGEIK